MLTIIFAILHIFLRKIPKTTNNILKILLLWSLIIVVGISSIWAFIGHIFFSDLVAKTIGWVPGSPFQYEVGIENLSYGILGLLCWKFRDNFWTATIIGLSVFYLGAAFLHIMDAIKHGNYAPGNTGFALYVDILLPVVLICLLIGYKLTLKKELARENI